MKKTFRLPTGDRRSDRLAVRLDRPSTGGDGSLAVLYLHGFGSTQAGEKASFFRRRFVAAGLPFCSLDFRGHGDSDGSMRELSLSRNLDDARHVRRELEERGFSRFLVVGSSMGGLTGLWLSALDPGSIEAGVHIAPAVDLLESLTRGIGPEAVERWKTTGLLEWQDERGSFELGWAFVEDLRGYTLARLRSAYRTPCLLLHGREDDQVSWEKVVEFATGASCREIELHLFVDGDHRLVDRLEQIWTLTEAFLERRGLLP